MEVIDEHTAARLLRRARRIIESELSGGVSRLADESPWPVLERRGVFVTLRKSNRLRGCIGTFSPTEDLPDTVAEMAKAATRDPRFTDMAISVGELKDIRIELSILSPLERIRNPLSFELRHHGIYLKYGAATGCFLPDVGTDLGWSKEQFLSELCRQKARLNPDAWRNEQAEVFRFTVQKFTE